MLQKKTVEARTYELIKELESEPMTSTMRLVGGTSLSLQIAHRKSTDIDLFSVEPFNTSEALDLLHTKYNFETRFTNRGTIIGFIDGIKVDMIHHPHEWISDPIIEDGIVLASIKDIAAMKLHAIANSGQRPKDFVDLAFLSKYFSYNQMKEFALEKYPHYDSIAIDKSINYFNDIDDESIDLIRMIGYRMEWIRIEDRLLAMTDDPDRIFKKAPLSKHDIRQ